MAVPSTAPQDMSEKALVQEILRRKADQDRRQRDTVTALTLANKVRPSLSLPSLSRLSLSHRPHPRQ